MSLTHVHFFLNKKIKKKIKKNLKKFKKKSKKSQNDMWQLLFTSVNDLDGVNRKELIEKI